MRKHTNIYINNLYYYNNDIDCNSSYYIGYIGDFNNSSFCGLGYQGKENPTTSLRPVAGRMAYNTTYTRCVLMALIGSGHLSI